MKRFLKFYHKDKQFVKMTNQSEKGFELIILSDKILNEFLELVNNCEEQGDELFIVWQMKFKRQNYTLYKNCTVSAPMNNFNPFARTTEDKAKPYGKKFKVICSGSTNYGEVENLSLRVQRNQKYAKYKDVKLLIRMLKIGELNLKGE